MVVCLCSYYLQPKEPTPATTGVIAFSKAGEKQTAELRPGSPHERVGRSNAHGTRRAISETPTEGILS